MTRSSNHRVVLAALLVAACSDTPATPLMPDVGGGELRLVFPVFDPLTLVTTTLVDTEPAEPLGPARVIEPGEEPPESELTGDEVPADASSNIYDARTIASISPGRAMAFGDHRYQGNKGRIETTINLHYAGQPIGSQTAATEQSGVFFNIFGIKYISAAAYVYTQLQCDLMAWGNSRHFAWVEAALGSNSSVFDRTERATRSDPVYTDACPPPEPPPTNGGSGGDDNDDGGGDGGVCWVSVWYDEDSGEVVDYDVLFCEDVIGG